MGVGRMQSCKLLCLSRRLFSRERPSAASFSCSYSIGIGESRIPRGWGERGNSMAVPRRLNGLMEEEDNNNEGEEWVDLSLPHELSPELVAIANAAESGDVEGLRAALDNWNGSVDDPVEDGDSALHLVCLYGHLPCVQLLLERRANLEVKDDDRAIPLHDACAGGFIEIVQLLVNSACNPDDVKRMLNTVDIEGDTPLHHASRGEHLDIVRYLLSVGASHDRINIFGKTPAELSDPGTEVRRLLEDAFNNPAVWS